mmetsp:Transcript_10504/g.31667  ORF Transcript_10504/g.31667 Transcript_10504/m.31667 type:complete len:291 (-) Transcript_10504:733-1605(-)
MRHWRLRSRVSSEVLPAFHLLRWSFFSAPRWCTTSVVARRRQSSSSSAMRSTSSSASTAMQRRTIAASPRYALLHALRLLGLRFGFTSSMPSPATLRMTAVAASSGMLHLWAKRLVPSVPPNTSRRSPHVSGGASSAALGSCQPLRTRRVTTSAPPPSPSLALSAASRALPYLPPKPRTSRKGMERIMALCRLRGTMVCLFGLFRADASLATTRFAAMPALTVKPVASRTARRMRSTTTPPARSSRALSVSSGAAAAAASWLWLSSVAVASCSASTTCECRCVRKSSSRR